MITLLLKVYFFSLCDNFTVQTAIIRFQIEKLDYLRRAVTWNTFSFGT